MPDYSFDAVIFDLDGVITRTALVHSAAWKEMFDEYMRRREADHGETFREFTLKDDYLPYVDGKPRYRGVESFLQSRGISIPFGDPSDEPDKETICGLGNRKNLAFNKVLAERGVSVYESTVKLIHGLKSNGIRVGVASSSKNCEAVLAAAGLLQLMETRVDGVVSENLNLKGKPEPDIFTVACDNLGVTYDRAVVVEDAVSGVRAGKAGNFGLVIGIAREENEKELLAGGADIVVRDMEEVSLATIQEWFGKGLVRDNWALSYHDYDPEREKTREALLAVGNGYFGTRGAMEEAQSGKFHYPGTYMAGVFNRLVSKVAGRDIENEDFVNGINWLPVSFRIDEGPWFDIDNVDVVSIRRVLHFRSGVLWRRMTVRDTSGRMTRIESRRMASMHDPHLAALEYTLIPLNWSGKVELRSGLESRHINAGVERYSQLNQQHLVQVRSGGENGENFLVARTSASNIQLAAACRNYVLLNETETNLVCTADNQDGLSFTHFCQNLCEGDRLTLHKIVATLNSLSTPGEDLPGLAREKAAKYLAFDEAHAPSEKSWEGIWDRIDIRVTGDRLAQKLLRLHLYHLMVTLSPHNQDIDAGIPARGLHGEAYRGHIFWDELFILPFYYINFKDVARSVLMYRYRRLDAARHYALEHGFRGAMFPWQSGSDGREETQVMHLNPVSGEWGPDHSALQRHVSLAIAYNTWMYYWITGDRRFMEDYGAELLFEVCRFWVSKSNLQASSGRYSISGVMGPDEFHEHSPGSFEGGLRDNAYTNIMVAWMLEKAFILMENLPADTMKKVYGKIGLSPDETKQWGSVAAGLRLVISPEGIIAQYDGYFGLKELDWQAYRAKYGNIHRMDRLLKAEGRSPDEFKVAKQADTLMTFYNLEKPEADRILSRLGYTLPEDYLQRNLRYYLDRTSHGSTLSRVVHARLANLAGDAGLGWRLYLDALTSDYQDIQGGTTAEGIHAGVMAGTVWIALNTFGGLDLSAEHPAFNPRLPGHWRSLSFGFDFRGAGYECEVSRGSLRIRAEGEDPGFRITVQGHEHWIRNKEWAEIPLSPLQPS